MPSSQYRMVIDDPSKISLLTKDMRETLIKGAAQTVNIQVALTRKNAIQNIKNDFTLRNNFVTGGINLHFDKANEDATRLEDINATFGATRQFMQRQEEGGVHDDPKGHRLAIPTDAARGGSRSSAVSKSMYAKNVSKKMYKYNPTYKGYSASTNLVRIAEAAFENDKFLKYNKNIYRVTNFRKSGDNVNFDLEMIYLRDKTETKTPKKEWLAPATEKPAQDAQKIFNSQMNKLEKFNVI